MWNPTSLDGIEKMLLNDDIVGIPIEELQLLERIKDRCFPLMGPLAVGIDMKLEMFILKRDRDLTGNRWY